MAAAPLHPLHAQLLDVGAIGEALEPFHPRVRDRDDVRALRCPRTDVVLLDRIDHVDASYYPDKDHPELAALGDRDRVVAAHSEDTTRRADQLRVAVTNRDWVDVGTGAGALLDALAGVPASATAVEPQGQFHALLTEQGHAVARDIADLPDGSADVLTEFHVFEHVPDPVGHLRHIRRVLRPGGRLVLEVPHARDVLLDLYDLEAFRAFTLWSEHLVLHTRESLRRLLADAGFERIVVSGFQRYPLANHLHWLARGAPGGHDRWSMLRDRTLDDAYGAVLARVDGTDTLIAEALAPAT